MMSSEFATFASNEPLTHEAVYSGQYDASEGLREVIRCDETMYVAATELLSSMWESWDQYVSGRAALFF